METWFKETFGDIQGGWRIKQVLHQHRSSYQDILVVDTFQFGRMLVLDGCVMTTEKDEFVYHEMLTHLALLAHPNPKHVCVVGGGDGGTIREVLKHKLVEKAVLAEIDGDVVSVCEEFFPGLAGCLRKDARVELAIGDGFKYLAEHADSFDIILSDSTDPIGPGAALFDDEYFGLAKKSLRSGGIFVSQCKSLWTDVETAWDIERRLAKQFTHVGAFQATIPTYPTGSWSFMFGSDSYDMRSVADPVRQREICQHSRYYTTAHQTAAFALPAFYFQRP